MNSPDWGYIGFAFTVVGLGVVFWVAGVGADYLVGPVLMLLGALLMLFSLRPSLSSLFRRPKPRAEVLKVEVAKWADLDGLWRKDNPGSAGLHGRTFAVLRVRNDGAANLLHLVARCEIEGKESPCHWSGKPGALFALGGISSASLNVGESRLLAVALAFPAQRLWARLTENQESLWSIAPVTTTLDGVDVRRYLLSRDREYLELGHRANITLRFLAEGVDETACFNLGFKKTRAVWEPTITPVTPAAITLRL